jgi:4-amino-4-deoxy-L-arabinose transferase-like glycosyltransferase
MQTTRRHWISALLALLCGLALRVFLVHKFPFVQGDSLIYGTIAINWLQHGVYGSSDDFTIPTLIRLPGYPLFLAVVFKLFGIGNYLAAIRFQIVADMATCVLIALFVRDHAGNRAALLALWLAALCPFTANYVAAPLTETLSIFCVALAMLAASRCVLTGFADWRWLTTLTFALSYAILLRPDGGLLAAAVLGYFFLRALFHLEPRAVTRRLIAVSLFTLLPLLPWTIRNWHTFHVFQPLAPRYANDPGSIPEAGFNSWVRTWFADAASNEEFFWCSDDCPLDLAQLPNRAFDSANQRRRTAALLATANQATEAGTDAITPAVDAQFASLAAERNSAHPLRGHVELPALRLADMLLRPRTELFPVPARWWEFHAHVRASWFALAYAGLNLAYLLLAAVGFLRRRVPLAPMLLAYMALRCALLLTLENAEPRYTLEFFPIIFVAAALALW